MRTDIHMVNFTAPDGLNAYAEKRLYQSTRPWQRRVAWVGVWLVGRDARSDNPHISCRMDAWISGVGIVTVRHMDSNPFVAVDIASVRLAQTIQGKMRLLARRSLRNALRPGAGHPSPTLPATSRPGPRLALVLERSGLPRRLSIQPWLSAKYGIEQVLRLSLPAHLWHAASENTGLAGELRCRLDQTLRGKPELIVILGRSNGRDDSDTMRREQDRVRQIGEQLRSWDLPVEIATLWTKENWESDCDVQSMELSRLPHGGGHEEALADPPTRSTNMDHPTESEVLSCA